jgi:single-strand DNA-binding protein
MANDINQVVLVGRLTRDAELKYTNTGTAIGKFSIAVNRRKRSGDQWTDEVSYFDIVLWGKTAEALNQYLQKGKQIAVAGELRQNRWEQDGQNRSKVEVIANNVQLLGGSGRGSDGPARSNNTNTGMNNAPQADTGSYSDDFEDDIPF